MRSSRLITLFAEKTDRSRWPASTSASLLVHGAAIGLTYLAMTYTPQIGWRLNPERLTVRRLDLKTPDQAQRGVQGGDSEYSRYYPTPSPIALGTAPSQEAAALKQTAESEPGSQTIVQPDLSSRLKLPEETPVPAFVIWSPTRAMVKTIVAPLPKQPTGSEVTPSIVRPNDTEELADVSISSATTLAQKLPVSPGTSSPIVVRHPELPQAAPSTTSQTTAQPTPAAVMSLSNFRMVDATVSLPPVNQTAAANASGALGTGQAPGPSHSGSGSPAGKIGAAGGQGNSSAANSNGAGEATHGATEAAGASNSANAGQAQASGAGAGPGAQPSATIIDLPQNGRYGSVVVGTSLQDQYPESAGVWGGRLAYTVYLHVGLANSWILQYALPREADAASGGNIARLEAPWPYHILRPDLEPGSVDADALMVHGFINQAGRFEMLRIVFPPAFPQAQLVLNSLQQWQFRPALQNGQIARVEVLLLIPEDLD